MKCLNVDGAYSHTPLSEAKRIMSQTEGLIAIAPCRKNPETGAIGTSQAVKEEIILSFATDRPFLVFKEKGVPEEGMMSREGAPLEFERGSLFDPKWIEKVVRSVHQFKMQLVGRNQRMYGHDPGEIFADYASQVIELKEQDGDYFWQYRTAKSLRFLKPFHKPIPVTYFAVIPPSAGACLSPIDIDIDVHHKSEGIDCEIEIVERSPQKTKNVIKMIPNPKDGDLLSYSAHSASRHFNAVFQEDLQNQEGLEINGKKYFCADGFVYIQRTRDASVEIRFPRGFPLKESEIVAFAGPYTDEVDSIDEAEMERIDVEFTERGGVIEAKLSVDYPNIAYMYGFAWNPPSQAEVP